MQDQEKQFGLVRLNVCRASDHVTLSSVRPTPHGSSCPYGVESDDHHTLDRNNGASILPATKGKFKLTVIGPIGFATFCCF